MTIKEFLEERNKLAKELEKQKNENSAKYTKLFNQFLEENIQVQKHKVYELAEPGISRRKYKRFVVYTLQPQTFSKQDTTLAHHAMIIQAGGWWLDKDNVPAKWDTIYIYGNMGKPTDLVLSEDQTNHPHPESDEAKKGAES